ncbi:MAG: 50S ribosomal protein L21 [Proteobacteria bacterium]|jgi:large subunit ribosomal protein L21|nr:50S ribosomal protein L21 [Pseudomonadota bacterium]
MQAVIKTGGKQYKVSVGDTLKVEKLTAKEGETIKIDNVLALVDGENTTIGAPLVKGANIDVSVVAHGKHDKVKIFKMKRRKHYKKSQGHRQNYTELKIEKINAK